VPPLLTTGEVPVTDVTAVVKYVLVSNDQVFVAVFFNNPVVPAIAPIACKSASYP
jgi:hypothetical protein